jgi:hypothetical protein
MAFSMDLPPTSLLLLLTRSYLKEHPRWLTGSRR